VAIYTAFFMILQWGIKMQILYSCFNLVWQRLNSFTVISTKNIYRHVLAFSVFAFSSTCIFSVPPADKRFLECRPLWRSKWRCAQSSMAAMGQYLTQLWPTILVLFCCIFLLACCSWQPVMQLLLTMTRTPERTSEQCIVLPAWWPLPPPPRCTEDGRLVRDRS